MGFWTSYSARDSGHRCTDTARVRRGGQRGARQDQGQQRRLPDDQPWLGFAVMVGILLAYKTGAHLNPAATFGFISAGAEYVAGVDVNFSNTSPT